MTEDEWDARLRLAARIVVGAHRRRIANEIAAAVARGMHPAVAADLAAKGLPLVITDPEEYARLDRIVMRGLPPSTT